MQGHQRQAATELDAPQWLLCSAYCRSWRVEGKRVRSCAYRSNTLRELCVNSDNDDDLLLVLMKIKQFSPLHCNSWMQWCRLSSFRYFNLYSSTTYGYNLQKHNSVVTKPSINSWRICVITKRYIHLGVDHTSTAEHVPCPQRYSRNCAASGWVRM